MPDNKKVVIYGGGTIEHITSHFALSAPAYGNTARYLASRCGKYLPRMDVDLRLTRMAGGPTIETTNDLRQDILRVVDDPTTKVVIMTAAVVDFRPEYLTFSSTTLYRDSFSKNVRLKSRERAASGLPLWGNIQFSTAEKIISLIRKKRKDIFLVGFKTSTDVCPNEQYIDAMTLCKGSSCNLVFSNDTVRRNNMIVTPEEARYHEGEDRNTCLDHLLEMVNYRTHLTFTRSTVVDGQPVAWNDANIPSSLKKVVEYCIANNAYKPFNGVTTGHFAFKESDNTFITSIRRTNFNDIAKNGMVKIVTDGPDTVLAYGAKPSVGGQSQRIIFHDHPDLDCIVHFHCPKKNTSGVPTVSQREFECGSHECGQNTSNGLKKFGNLWAVYLDNHGPNIVFNRNVNPEEVISFIKDNFSLDEKTGGYLTLIKSGRPSSFLGDFVNVSAIN